MSGGDENSFLLHGARCLFDFACPLEEDLSIRNGRIERIVPAPASTKSFKSKDDLVDLNGYLVLPGLINAHDHLEFALYPRLAEPPYRNYTEWGEDIHAKFAAEIEKQKSVPKTVRIMWGAIRNLLSGVTTVCHHNPLLPEMLSPEFPVGVISAFGWAHSLALGGDLRAARARTPEGHPFIVHACEGADDFARGELWQLDSMGLLDKDTVLVHALATDSEGVALIRTRGSAVIACPSSNKFLFNALPDLKNMLRMDRVALGSDSPLTAIGDLLDEMCFAIRECDVSPKQAFDMVTRSAAEILRLQNGEGQIQEGGVADLVVIRDSGVDFSERMRRLSSGDIELVMIGGRVHAISEELYQHLPAHMTAGLELLSVGEMERWVRAPISDLVEITKNALGQTGAMLGGKKISAPVHGVAYAC